MEGQEKGEGMQTNRGQHYIRYWEGIILCEAWVARGRCGCPIQDHGVGWGFEKSDLGQGDPTHGTQLCLNSLPIKTIVWLHGSVVDNTAVDGRSTKHKNTTQKVNGWNHCKKWVSLVLPKMFLYLYDKLWILIYTQSHRTEKQLSWDENRKSNLPDLVIKEFLTSCSAELRFPLQDWNICKGDQEIIFNNNFRAGSSPCIYVWKLGFIIRTWDWCGMRVEEVMAGCFLQNRQLQTWPEQALLIFSQVSFTTQNTNNRD